ncbi:MAG: AsnC family transcriptional regulator [Nitrosarchaeum sp.]|jgi:DNA-binding Lrp family transcriptional regulator|uniref:AsnC family transcriptional regulator n=1 Tax=Nitrosarchaeum sp. TaxID=2026886 RepID=UPI002DEE2FEF|nr:AsnC family transcriptional regulator [Nitrosarchaeum sp.]MEC4847674.1 AsnC family transcriptional regulator [Nitrosarchaeum sp.]
MPFQPDEIDIAIIESLIKDGRKSFRQISREIKVSTPTVQARYERLVNVGLIKSISPIIDLGMLENKTEKHFESIKVKSPKKHDVKITKDMILKMICDLCKGPISDKPHVLKIADFERFFCCTSCRTLYKEKYRGRIETLNHKI